MRLDEHVLQPVEPFEADLDLRLALEGLPQEYQELLVLVHVYGYSCPEVAAMRGTTAGAVRTALYRARGAAREVLS